MSDSRNRQTANGVREAALAYLARGWSVIPIRPRDKRPIIAWQDYQQRQPAVSDIEHWLSRWPDANIAVVTGSISGLVVIDVDPRHKGAQSMRALELEYGPLPQTVEARSGGGGRHLYFSHPGGHVHNKVDLAPGVDVRGDGGLIVAPPSRHPSGGRYQWIRGPDEIDLARLPSWLLTMVEPATRLPAHPPTYWRKLLADGVAEGSRNNSIASIAGHLLWHGVDSQVVMELLLCWNRVRCRPPLADEEVVRTITSITRLHHRRTSGDQ